MTTEDLIKRDMKYTSVNGVSIEEYVNKNYIHMSVIEDIKAEILKVQYRIDDSATLSTRDVVNVEDIEDIIDKHIGGKE